MRVFLRLLAALVALATLGMIASALVKVPVSEAEIECFRNSQAADAAKAQYRNSLKALEPVWADAAQKEVMS